MPRAADRLPQAAAAAVGRCGICDHNPRPLCDRCPKRLGTTRDRLADHGWNEIRRVNSPQVAESLERSAKLARALANLPDSHPAMPELLQAYQAEGQKLARLRTAAQAQRSA